MSEPAFGIGKHGVDLPEIVGEVTGSHRLAAKLGARLEAEHFYRAIRTLDVAYRRALQDPETKVPTYMAATIYGLISMLPECETVEATVDKLIGRRA